MMWGDGYWGSGLWGGVHGGPFWEMFLMAILESFWSASSSTIWCGPMARASFDRRAQVGREVGREVGRRRRATRPIRRCTFSTSVSPRAKSRKKNTRTGKPRCCPAGSALVLPRKPALAFVPLIPAPAGIQTGCSIRRIAWVPAAAGTIGRRADRIRPFENHFSLYRNIS